MSKQKNQYFKQEIYFFNRIFMVSFILLSILCLWLIIQQPSIPLVILLFIILSFPLLFGKMVITVKHKELRVAFGYTGLIKKRIPLIDIVSSEIVTYKPIRDFGGWGIRCGRFRGEKTGCLSLKGNQGVLLTLMTRKKFCIVKTNKLIIGSQDSQKLIAAIGKGIV